VVDATRVVPGRAGAALPNTWKTKFKKPTSGPVGRTRDASAGAREQNIGARRVMMVGVGIATPSP
jgi:hypothetical protein